MEASRLCVGLVEVISVLAWWRSSLCWLGGGHLCKRPSLCWLGGSQLYDPLNLFLVLSSNDQFNKKWNRIWGDSYNIKISLTKIAWDVYMVRSSGVLNYISKGLCPLRSTSTGCSSVAYSSHHPGAKCQPPSSSSLIIIVLMAGILQ